MAYSPDINLRQFHTADVIVALPRPIDMVTFKNWIRRPDPAVLLADGDHELARAGRFHLLHFRHAIQTALVSEFVGLGLLPRRAGLIASFFANAGGRDGRAERLPGTLFAEGETFIRAYAGPDPLRPDAKVMAVSPRTSALSLFRDATFGYTGAVLLHVNPIVEHLRYNLGMPNA